LGEGRGEGIRLNIFSGRIYRALAGKGFDRSLPPWPESYLNREIIIGKTYSVTKKVMF
jgi:hypothetical protein